MSFTRYIAMAGLCLALISPARAEDHCRIDVDQFLSLPIQPIATLPMRVLIDSDFTSSHVRHIRKAIKTWNKLGHELIGKAFFEVDEVARVDFDRLRVGTKYCQLKWRPQGLVILREDSTKSWNASDSFSSDARAYVLKRPCSVGNGTDHAELNMVVNTALTEYEQFQSVVLHELGHTLGLDHSCAKSEGSLLFRSCKGLKYTDSYRTAVMYPWLESSKMFHDRRSIKESLGKNDIERLRCAYSGLARQDILKQLMAKRAKKRRQGN